MSSIRPVLQSVDRALEMEVKRQQTVGHLRRVARDIAHNLYGVTDETAETVALQDEFSKCLTRYCEAMRSPVSALNYLAPDAVRALLTAQSPAAQAEIPTSKDGE
ncbi:hypothetical protein [EBPR siphovirus 2]|nr:hypothetical protein [EBPR siphovirus 2]